MYNIIICGKIATGKTTLASLMENRGFTKVITYTTRKPRPGEENGVDYNFISENEFRAMMDRGELIMITKNTSAQTWYGAAKNDFERSKMVAILDPVGVKYLADHADEFPRTEIVYLRAPDYLCIQNAIKRGDELDAIFNRMRDDDPNFNALERASQYTMLVNISDLNDMPDEEMADMIIEACEKEE